jgi:hypothetical protein
MTWNGEEIVKAVDNGPPWTKKQQNGFDSTSETAPCMLEAARAWRSIIDDRCYAQQ